MHHLILGAGPAGVIAAETIRKHAPHDDITVVGDEAEPPYSRMAIPYLLIGNVGESGTHLRHGASHFADQRIELVHARAKSVDVKAKNVALDNGQSLSFDKLLIATGSTPTGVYDELVRLHKEEGLSFRNVVTFNLDEYWPMQPHELQSYHRFMREHLFDRIDIDQKHAHIPDGTCGEDDVRAMCDRYEREIKAAGGIDLQILGIGRTGHIGFNEPGSGRSSRTRLITLDRVTRKDAASDFFGEENVPTRAVTMGVGTILEAKRVVMIAFGEGFSSYRPPVDLKTTAGIHNIKPNGNKEILLNFITPHQKWGIHSTYSDNLMMLTRDSDGIYRLMVFAA